MQSIIALGSNMGDRSEYLKEAQEKISQRVGQITGKSKIFRN